MTDRVQIPANIKSLCREAEMDFGGSEPKEYREFMNSVALCTLNKIESLGHIKSVLKVWEDNDGWGIGNQTLYAWIETHDGTAVKYVWNDANRGFMVKSRGAVLPKYGNITVTQEEYNKFGV